MKKLWGTPARSHDWSPRETHSSGRSYCVASSPAFAQNQRSMASSWSRILIESALYSLTN